MNASEQNILDRVKAVIGERRLENAIVYLHPQPLKESSRMQVGDIVLTSHRESSLVFVDLEPRLNWGHDCLYLLISDDTDNDIEAPAQMPPFLKAGGPEFRFLWRGSRAPQWAVATD